MFLIIYLAIYSFLLNSCLSKQICIDSCSFYHHFDDQFILPSDCIFIERDQCDVLLNFQYLNRSVHIKFGALSFKKQINNYTKEISVHTLIKLDDDLATENIIEYYCSTFDRCEYDYLINQALKYCTYKTCFQFRENLISLLRPNSTSMTRSCMTENDDIEICIHPCELFFVNPFQIFRSCSGQTHLQFETSIARTFPINKPEYQYRLYSFSCTSDLCNGYAKQKLVENLLESSDNDCLISFDNETQTTTNSPVTPFNQSSSILISYYPMIIFLLFHYYQKYSMLVKIDC